MNLKHQDIEISNEKPFENCKLNRKPFAEVLTSIIQKYTNGFVLAINNEWGTGKTTFVKMWQQHLTNQEFKTLYFNAWENDFQSDPLVAIISELKKLDKGKTKKTFKKVVSAAAPYAKKLIPLLLKAGANKVFSEEGANELINAGVDVTAEELEDEINSYNKKKDGIKGFKNSLTEFIEEIREASNKEDKKDAKEFKPIVFIIDELDRCRPNYAVETLEKLKHFFDVPGIVFVLAVDKTQLEAAVCGVYGSDKINAKEYLRRFIDVEFSIPQPDTRTYCKYLFEYFDFVSFVRKEERLESKVLASDENNFIDFASKLFEGLNLSLRIQEKIFAHAKLVIDTLQPRNYLFPDLIIFLIYIKHFYNEFYVNIKNRKISYQDLTIKIEEIVEKVITVENYRDFLYLEGHLLKFYHNYDLEFNFENKLIINEGENRKLSIESNLKFEKYNQGLIEIIDHISRERYGSLKIDFLLNKIDLTEPVLQ